MPLHRSGKSRVMVLSSHLVAVLAGVGLAGRLVGRPDGRGHRGSGLVLLVVSRVSRVSRVGRVGTVRLGLATDADAAHHRATLRPTTPSLGVGALRRGPARLGRRGVRRLHRVRWCSPARRSRRRRGAAWKVAPKHVRAGGGQPRTRNDRTKGQAIGRVMAARVTVLRGRVCTGECCVGVSTSTRWPSSSGRPWSCCRSAESRSGWACW